MAVQAHRYIGADQFPGAQTESRHATLGDLFELTPFLSISLRFLLTPSRQPSGLTRHLSPNSNEPLLCLRRLDAPRLHRRPDSARRNRPVE